MRVVYDGAPEAGKTTNVISLTRQVGLSRRGAVDSPGSSGRRTEFFDWTDFAGGYVDGRRVRCQLVSVPGQPELLHRRRYLLESADAVVYVVDSRPEHSAQTRAGLARTRRALARLERGAGVGLVVQANKQDLTGALSPEALASELELPPEVAILPASAHLDTGVLRTFTFAATLATDRVRAVLAASDPVSQTPVCDSPAELYRAMLRLDSQRALGETLRHDSAKAPLPPGLADVALDVYPPVKGRGLLSRADLDTAFAPAQVQAWAPSEALELRTEAGFTLHSTHGWCSTDAAAARSQLLEWVQESQRWEELAFSPRAAFVAPEPQRSMHRIWVLTAPFLSVTRWLEQRLAERDAEGLRAGCQLLRSFEQRAIALSRRVELSLLAMSGSQVSCVALDAQRAPVAREGQLLNELLDRVRSQSEADAELSRWLAERPSLWRP